MIEALVSARRYAGAEAFCKRFEFKTAPAVGDELFVSANGKKFVLDVQSIRHFSTAESERGSEDVILACYVRQEIDSGND